jgi:hypothetical protein
MIRSLQDFLLGVSATDRDLLRELEGDNPDAQIHRKRVGLGAAILLTFVVTWASTAWMAMTFEAGLYLSIASGLLAGLLKLVWDRQVAAATAAGQAWGRVGLRVILGGLISIAMATPLALFSFGDFAVEASKKEERQSITSTYEDKLGEREALEAEVDSLRSAKNFYKSMVEAERGGLTRKEAGLTDEQLERYGVEAPSGKQSCGPRCEAYQQRAQGYVSALEAKKKELSALPTRKELRDRRETALTELEQETKNAVTRLIELYRKELSGSWVSSGLFLVIILIFTFVDLLPVTESLLASDPYTKAQKARNKEKERERAIQRAKAQGELRKTRAATWIEALIIDLILEEADSEDVSLEQLKELMDKLYEFEAPQGDSPPEDPSEESSGQKQQPTDGAGGNLRREGMSGGYPDLRPGTSAGDGAPSPEEESGGSDEPRENGRLLLPPANGREGS